MTDYTVAAEFMLRDWVSPTLDKIIERLDKAIERIGEFQDKLDRIGGGGINRLLRSLDKLQTARFPNELAEGATQFDAALVGADARLAAMTKHAAELAAAMKELRVPSVPALPGERPAPGTPRGAGHSSDAVMQGVAGGAYLEFLSGNYERYSAVDQVYRSMQADSNLAGDSPAMKAIRDQASGQLARYTALKPLDVAKNAAEAYTLGGGKLAEQAPLADMLDRLEQSLMLRGGKSPEDAQRQAAATLKALDIANRFFDPRTGQFSLDRGNVEVRRMQALIGVGGGFTTGQSLVAFKKSAGLAGQRLSLEGEAKLAHFIEINPSRSGTALKSLETLFGGSAPRMTKKDKAAFTAAGLYDRSGQLVDQDLFYSDPIGFIEKHAATFSNVRINDDVQRQTVAGLLGETLGAQGNINRGAAATARQNADANSGNLQSSPAGAALRFDAALEGFRVELGRFEAGPGVKILDTLTSGLRMLDDVMIKNPNATDAVLKLTAALGAFALARGVVSLLGIGDGVAALSRGLALFGKGSAASTALAAIGAEAGAGSLFGLAGGIVALGAALLAVPPILRDLLGDPAQNTHPNTDARGHAYANRPAPTDIGPPPKPQPWGVLPQVGDGIDGWLNRSWSVPVNPHANNRGGVQLQRQSYETGASPIHMQPLNISLTLDGRVIARNSRMHQTRQDQSGRNGFDPIEYPRRPALPVVA